MKSMLHYSIFSLNHSSSHQLYNKKGEKKSNVAVRRSIKPNDDKNYEFL